MAVHPSARQPLTDYFSHLMYRQYISDNSVWGGGRPQFLFAEPSYIGMHLFGILLPLMWLMRGRDRIYAKRLRDSSSRMRRRGAHASRHQNRHRFRRGVADRPCGAHRLA